MKVKHLRKGDVVEVLGEIAALSTFHNGELWYEITFEDGSKLHRKADAELPLTSRGYYSVNSYNDPVSGVRFNMQVMPDDTLYVDVETYGLAPAHRHPNGLPRIYISVDHRRLADFTKEAPEPFFVLEGVDYAPTPVDGGTTLGDEEPYWDLRDWRDGEIIDTIYDNDLERGRRRADEMAREANERYRAEQSA